MRILLATDSWLPEINGISTTLASTARELRAQGHEVALATPGGLRTSVPTASATQLISPTRGVARMIQAFDPHAIHVATEGPIGLAARRHCIAARREFTTAPDAEFPENVNRRCGVPLDVAWRWLSWFHAPAAASMVSTRALQARLHLRGLRNLALWPRGVDTHAFSPAAYDAGIARRPIVLFVGHLDAGSAVADFLALDLPGARWIVGDGSLRDSLQRDFPTAVFHGLRQGDALVRLYQQADVLAYPARCDGVANVLLEAMACGTPVAALPAGGASAVVEPWVSGVLDADLRRAVFACLALDRTRVRACAARFTWASATSEFLANLHPAEAARATAVS